MRRRPSNFAAATAWSSVALGVLLGAWLALIVFGRLGLGHELQPRVGHCAVYTDSEPIADGHPNFRGYLIVSATPLISDGTEAYWPEPSSPRFKNVSQIPRMPARWCLARLPRTGGRWRYLFETPMAARDPSALKR